MVCGIANPHYGICIPNSHRVEFIPGKKEFIPGKKEIITGKRKIITGIVFPLSGKFPSNCEEKREMPQLVLTMSDTGKPMRDLYNWTWTMAVAYSYCVGILYEE